MLIGEYKTVDGRQYQATTKFATVWRDGLPRVVQAWWLRYRDPGMVLMDYEIWRELPTIQIDGLGRRVA